uniref:Uncharacterized protein n=1 Tax=Anopheles albimanus TaxID=7167 RepID=A0A182FRM8_ANOAL
MLTDPKLRTALTGLPSPSPDTIIKREPLLDSPLDTGINHRPDLDDRLRLPHCTDGLVLGCSEPGGGVGVRSTLHFTGHGQLPLTAVPQLQNKQPLQGFDQIWGPARTDMRDRLQASVSGMSHYWPPYDSEPAPAVTSASSTAAVVDPPQDMATADGHIYTLTVLHESPEHGIVWSDPNALDSPVPLAPDIVDSSAGYEPPSSVVDCFNFDGAGYDLGDYYAATTTTTTNSSCKPQVQSSSHQQQHQQQQQQHQNGSSPSITGQQHQPASAISLHSTVEGLLNEIQLTSFSDQSVTSHSNNSNNNSSLYNEPSSYLYDNFAVPDSSSSSHHHHNHHQQQQHNHHQQPLLPSIATVSLDAMSATGTNQQLHQQEQQNHHHQHHLHHHQQQLQMEANDQQQQQQQQQQALLLGQVIGNC